MNFKFTRFANKNGRASATERTASYDYTSDYRANYVPLKRGDKPEKEPFHYTSNQTPPMLLFPAIRDKTIVPPVSARHRTRHITPSTTSTKPQQKLPSVSRAASRQIYHLSRRGGGGASDGSSKGVNFVRPKNRIFFWKS